MRVSAMGPSSSRDASHHQAASGAPRRPSPRANSPVTKAKATASTTKTRLSQAGAIQAEPNASAAIIGGSARIGYTHPVWIPTQRCSSNPSCSQDG